MFECAQAFFMAAERECVCMCVCEMIPTVWSLAATFHTSRLAGHLTSAVCSSSLRILIYFLVFWVAAPFNQISSLFTKKCWVLGSTLENEVRGGGSTWCDKSLKCLPFPTSNPRLAQIVCMPDHLFYAAGKLGGWLIPAHRKYWRCSLFWVLYSRALISS